MKTTAKNSFSSNAVVELSLTWNLWCVEFLASFQLMSWRCERVMNSSTRNEQKNQAKSFRWWWNLCRVVDIISVYYSVCGAFCAHKTFLMIVLKRRCWSNVQIMLQTKLIFNVILRQTKRLSAFFFLNNGRHMLKVHLLLLEVLFNCRFLPMQVVTCKNAQQHDQVKKRKRRNEKFPCAIS